MPAAPCLQAPGEVANAAGTSGSKQPDAELQKIATDNRGSVAGAAEESSTKTAQQALMHSAHGSAAKSHAHPFAAKAKQAMMTGTTGHTAREPELASRPMHSLLQPSLATGQPDNAGTRQVRAPFNTHWMTCMSCTCLVVFDDMLHTGTSI